MAGPSQAVLLSCVRASARRARISRKLDRSRPPALDEVSPGLIIPASSLQQGVCQVPPRHAPQPAAPPARWAPPPPVGCPWRLPLVCSVISLPLHWALWRWRWLLAPLPLSSGLVLASEGDPGEDRGAQPGRAVCSQAFSETKP
jgi:hypothetical protein